MADDRRLLFKRCLNRISNKLSRQNLEDLKFLARLVVPVGRMERVRMGTDLFIALEERGCLSVDNLELLSRMLASVGCGQLLGELEKEGFSVPKARPHMLPVTPRAMGPPAIKLKEYEFCELLLQISQGLSSTEVEKISFAYSDSLLNLSTDKIFSATALFQLLQQRQVITTDNLRPLYDELVELGRLDLASRINDYLKNTHQEPYDMYKDGNQGAIAASQDGQHHHTTVPVEENSHHSSHPPPPPSSSTSSGYTPASSHEQTGLFDYNPRQTIPAGDSRTSHVSMETQVKNTISSGNYAGEVGSEKYREQFSGPSGPTHSVRSPPPPYEAMVTGGSSGEPQFSMEESNPTLTHSTPLGSFTPSSFHYSEGRAALSGGNPSLGSAFYQEAKGNPFGLTFNDPVERPSSSSQRFGAGGGAGLEDEIFQVQRKLAQREGELRSKEGEIEGLQRELAEASNRSDHVVAERVSEVELYRANIKELEERLKTKNTEVAELSEGLKDLHQKLHTYHSSSAMDTDDLYKMNQAPHGICLIINNHKFYHPTDATKAHTDRGGAEIDQFNLTQTFRYLRYKVEVLENLTATQMLDTIQEMAHRRDHSRYDSFICCILTHGEKELVHGADSLPVNLNDFTGIMKYCTALSGKPKLFFIQACRGEKEDRGVLPSDREHDSGGNDHPSITQTIPQEADFFFGFATPSGSAAYRSRRHGSWYISELCKVLTDRAYTHNLSAMMKKVNDQVSKAYTKEGLKQVPETVDRLRKEVQFFHFIRDKMKSV